MEAGFMSWCQRHIPIWRQQGYDEMWVRLRVETAQITRGLHRTFKQQGLTMLEIRDELEKRYADYPELYDLARERERLHPGLLRYRGNTSDLRHPYDGSWGYQVTDYFAPTSRFGSPEDFQSFVEYLHQQGIGVLLDWVPTHFPKDGYALSYFDGTHLYEYADLRKGSLLSKMLGDVWQKFANLRALFGFMWGHPGKKLFFMGGEFGQWQQWQYAQSLDWHLLQPPHDAHHARLRDFVRDLNEQEKLVFVCNFTPVTCSGYRLGVPYAGEYYEVINSDATRYGGGGVENPQSMPSGPTP
jgi:1,4-alpha-glucan branching enzyme